MQKKGQNATVREGEEKHCGHQYWPSWSLNVSPFIYLITTSINMKLSKTDNEEKRNNVTTQNCTLATLGQMINGRNSKISYFWMIINKSLLRRPLGPSPRRPWWGSVVGPPLRSDPQWQAEETGLTFLCLMWADKACGLSVHTCVCV